MKKITVRESYPSKNSPYDMVSTRELTAPTYQELFEMIDKENHELLIFQVKSNNAAYNSGFYNIISAICLIAQASLITYMTSGMDANDFASNTIRKIVNIIFHLTVNIALVTAIGLVFNGIINIVKNKEIAIEGSEFVRKKYPDEYKSIKPVKSKKKIFKSNKEEEEM